MKQLPNITDIPIGERVETIQQLRLVTNTKTEWDDLYGRLKINQRKPKKEDNRIDETNEEREQAIYQIVYDSLTMLFDDTYQLKLDDFLEKYLLSSKKYCGVIQNLSRNKIKGQSLWSPNIIRRYLMEYIKPQPDYANIEGLRPSAIESLNQIEPALLLCWVQGWLPAYGSKVGDIEVSKNREHLVEAHNVLREMYTSKYETCFSISEHLYKLYRKKEDLNNMDLYLYVYFSLNRLKDLENLDELHDISYYSDYIDLEEICIEKNVAWKDADSNDIWTFESMGTGYIFKQYKRGRKTEDNSAQEKFFIRYEGCIVNEDDQLQLIIRFPKFIEYYLKNEQLPKEVLRKAPILLNTEEGSSKITNIEILLEEDVAGTLGGLPHKLERINYNFYQEALRHYRNLYPKYEYSSPYDMNYVERIVSPQFIYIARSRKIVGNHAEITSWYRIPVLSHEYLDALGDFPVDELITLINYQKETYIFLGHYVLSLQVTTIENCNENNIAIVKYPNPITFNNDVYFFKILSTSTKRIGENDVQIHSQVEIWKKGEDIKKKGEIIEVEEHYANIPFNQ